MSRAVAPVRGPGRHRGRPCHASAPQLTVEADGEPVALRPWLAEAGRSPRCHGRSEPGRPARDEYLLQLLGEGSHGDLVSETQFLQHAHTYAQLAFAAVEQEQLRRVGKTGPAPAAPVDDRFDLTGGFLATLPAAAAGPSGSSPSPGPAAEVVSSSREGGASAPHTWPRSRRSLDGGHLEPPVVASLRQAVLEHDHRAHVVGSLDVAHVVTLDPKRCLLQLEGLLQLLEGRRAAREVARPPQPVTLQLLLRILLRRRQELTFATPLWDLDVDSAVTQDREPLFVGGEVLGQLGNKQLPGMPMGVSA